MGDDHYEKFIIIGLCVRLGSCLTNLFKYKVA